MPNKNAKIAFLASIATLIAAPAFAQTQADQMKVAYEAARNQLGIIGYCADKGHTDTAAVDIQKKLLAMLPAPADKSGADAAEAAGRSGKLSAMGVTQDIEQLTKAQNTSTAAFCKQIGDMVKQMGAKLP